MVFKIKNINCLKVSFIILPLTIGLNSNLVLASSFVSCSDGSLNVTSPFDVTYANCVGSIPGNDVGDKGTLLTALNDDGIFDVEVSEVGNWELFDSGNVIADKSKSGNWSVEGLTTETFVVSIKAGNNYSAYLFDDIGFTATGGTFNVNGIHPNGGGKFAALSHMSIFNFSPEISAVPIPGAALLFGSALLGMFGFSLRKKQKST